MTEKQTNKKPTTLINRQGNMLRRGYPQISGLSWDVVHMCLEWVREGRGNREMEMTMGK